MPGWAPFLFLPGTKDTEGAPFLRILFPSSSVPLPQQMSCRMITGNPNQTSHLSRKPSAMMRVFKKVANSPQPKPSISSILSNQNI
jgi:hypothetical protein